MGLAISHILVKIICMMSGTRSMAFLACAISLPLAADCLWDAFEASQFDDCLALASQNKADAGYTIGMAYLTGTGVERDPVEGESWIQKSANQEYANAEYQMGLFDEAKFDRAENNNLVQAKEWFTLSAKHGNTDAAYSLALLFLAGKGEIVKNVDEATKYLTQAAEGGNSEASMYLSDLFLAGTEVTKNKDEALKWLTRAAQDGHSEAITKLGTAHLYGNELTSKNLTEAVKWLTKSANNDVIESQVMLAYLLGNDKDVPRNIPESLKWFLKVMEDGRSEEICEVFFEPTQYLRRHSVDSKKALDWCSKESKKGNANAQLAIAFINKDFKDGIPNNQLGKALGKKWQQSKNK